MKKRNLLFIIGILFLAVLLYPNQVNGETTTLYDVRDFGAVGDWDGTTGTDDSVAIQAAIDVASHKNAAVVFPSGYKFRANNLVLKSGVTIIGDGSTVVNDANNFYIPTFTASGELTSIMTALTADCPGGAYAGTVPITIQVACAKDFMVGDNIELSDDNGKEFNIIKNIDGAIITLQNRPIRTYTTAANAKITKINSVSGVIIQGLTIEHINPVAPAIKMAYSTNSGFLNVTIRNPLHGISLDNSERITINSCSITPGSAGEASHGVTLDRFARHCKVINNTFIHARPAVALTGEFCIIANNTITASGNGNTGDGITVLGSDNVINGNTIIGGDCYGIWIPQFTGYNPQRNQITSNSIEANITVGIYAHGGSDHIICGNILRQNSNGISVVSSGCVVESNVCIDNSNIGIALFGERSIVSGNRCKSNYNYGICIYDSADYCIVKNNILDGTGAIRTNTAINNIVKDNIINGVVT